MSALCVPALIWHKGSLGGGKGSADDDVDATVGKLSYDDRGAWDEFAFWALDAGKKK